LKNTNYVEGLLPVNKTMQCYTQGQTPDYGVNVPVWVKVSVAGVAGTSAQVESAAVHKIE
jgi:hypothetical protein